MFTSVFKGKTVAFASDAGVAHIALMRLLQSRKLKAYRFLHKDTIGSFVVDFVCHERRLIVELVPPRPSDRDLDRDRHLHELGYRLLKIHRAELMSRPDRVLGHIREVVQASRS